MLFGEITEPSTRALIDDELEEYPNYKKPEISWKGIKTVPQVIDCLILVENSKLIKLFECLVLKNADIYGRITNGTIKIYKLPHHNKYVVLYNEKELISGEVIAECLTEWLQRAKYLIALTAMSIASYQNLQVTNNKPECLIRVLATSNAAKFGYRDLESPNLMSGLGADCLSYSLHTGLECSLFAIYLDATPLLDSISIEPILNLLHLILGFELKEFDLKINSNSNNLYV